MRLYGKKFVKHMVDKRVKASVEGRDCIIWEVIKAEKLCRVRIQGSSTYIYAKFPQNTTMIPSWIRVGNSVKLSHRSGVRGHIYITGQGTSLPSMIIGDNTPDPGIAPNGTITGMLITATDPETMSVNIGDGTYRINDVEYNFGITSSPLYYDDPPPILYDSTPIIVYNELRATLDAPPAVRYFRYDAFFVGEDGVLDYVAGTVSKTPEKPAIPTGHILIDKYILVIGGHSVISNVDIGKIWTPTAASSIDINIEGDGISHSLPYDDNGTPSVPEDDPQYTYADIVFTVYDQYNNSLPGAYTFELEQYIGDGILWSNDSGYASTVQQYTTSAAYTFKFRREQATDHLMCSFVATTVIDGREFQLVGMITLE